MSTLRKIERLPVEDYLVSEQRSEVRHEYVEGVTVAMVGGTERHNAITLSLAATLREHLRGRGCRVFASERYAGADCPLPGLTSDSGRGIV